MPEDAAEVANESLLRSLIGRIDITIALPSSRENRRGKKSGERGKEGEDVYEKHIEEETKKSYRVGENEMGRVWET